KEGRIKAGRTVTVPAMAKDDPRFRVVSELELPPGEYQLRVAAVAGENGKEGSVHHDLLVPDLGARPLAVTDPVMTAAVAGDSIVFVDLPADRPKVMPTAVRSFARSTPLTVSGTLFVNSRQAAGTASLAISLRADDGSICSRTSDDNISLKPDDARP